MTQNPNLDKRKFFTDNPVLSLNFTSSFNLLKGNVDVQEFSSIAEDSVLKNVSKKSSETFGLFGGESQYNNFNPGTEPSDWQPKEEDFIYPAFRILSETTVVKFGTPIEFTSKALKPSVAKIEGQTVYPDHKNDEVGNSLGVVIKPSWQNAYQADGVSVPPGINGILKIDAKSNPRIARALLMSPPAIHSGSVKVSFKWAKSHTDLTEDEFWNKVGTFDKDGQLIRLVVNEVVSYGEYSLVTHGADRFAQKTENGKIVNPGYSEWSKVFSGDSSGDYKFDYDYRFPKTLSFSKDKTINPNINKTMDIIQLLNAKLPADQQLTESSTAEEVVSLFESLVTEKTSLEAKVTELQGVEPISESQAEILEFVETLGGFDVAKNLATLAQTGQTVLTEVRDRAVAQYKLANADNIQDAIIRSIENADLEAAKAFETTYLAAVEKSMPLTCTDCNSTNVTRSSHKKEKEETTAQSFNDDVEKESLKRRRKMSDIHKK